MDKLSRLEGDGYGSGRPIKSGTEGGEGRKRKGSSRQSGRGEEFYTLPPREYVNGTGEIT